MRNPMPDYWPAEPSLLVLLSGPKISNFIVHPDILFRVLGQWSLHIRDLLLSDQSDSSELWYDLAKIVGEKKTVIELA
jgi:hypothetical protein